MPLGRSFSLIIDNIDSSRSNFKTVSNRKIVSSYCISFLAGMFGWISSTQC